MTHVIKANNVNDALVSGLWWLHTAGTTDDSRNGRVIVSPEPVITEYQNPTQRVLFAPLRDANPFFHLLESLWMLAGRNDVRFPSHYAANLASFSDNGTTLHGAYGYRWRQAFGMDQLSVIINELTANPKSRRCVLAMWDASEQVDGCKDLTLAVTGGKDVPCNTHAYFDTLNGVLNMTVCNRSNDVVWGCYGANAVHFSLLHEFVSCATGIPLGVYRQLSNNYHIYADRPDVQRLLHADGAPLVDVDDRYATQGIESFPLMGNLVDWQNDMEYFFDAWEEGAVMTHKTFEDNFWRHVAVPVVNAHTAYKRGDFMAAFANLEQCQAEDWRMACENWIDRRKEKRNANR